MARGIEGNEIAEKNAKKSVPTSTQKSGQKQQTIANFFQKRQAAAPNAVTPAKRPSDASDALDASKQSRAKEDSAPASSSPLVALRSSQHSSVNDGRDKENGKLELTESTYAAD